MPSIHNHTNEDSVDYTIMEGNYKECSYCKAPEFNQISIVICGLSVTIRSCGCIIRASDEDRVVHAIFP